MKKWSLALVGVVLIVGACSGASTQEQTLAADNSLMRTEMAAVRTTATVEADRMMITLEYAQTEVRRVEEQQTHLVSTLVARGIPTESIANLTPQEGFAAATPVPQQPGISNPPVTTEEPAGGTRVPVTPFTLTPEPPRLSNIVTSEGVGANDCALGTTSQFTTRSPEIYVVATASNVPPGTTITSRWYNSQGNEVATFPFTPDFTIEQACVWFFITPEDASFTPGSWSVALEINGVSAGAAVPFTIIEAT